jgi:hypothetical protein
VLDKKPMEHCQYLDQGDSRYIGKSACGNCTVYDKRKELGCPTKYNCAWRAGYGDKNDRPDKSLILFDRSHLIENALEAKALKTNQENTPEGIRAIKNMSRSYGAPVLVLDYETGDIKRVVGRGI